MGKNNLVRGSLVGLLIAAQMACAPVPDSQRKKLGWEVKAKENVNVYEQSLRDEYIGGKNNDPRNEWRVRNYMMNYLAKEKAKGVNGGRVKDLLGQLDSLNVVDPHDSVTIMSIYSQIFVGEDTKFGSSTNSFVSEELVKRMKQVISYGGFDINGRLNEWGKLITMQGPFIEPASVGDRYVIATFPNGLTYKAVEGEDFDYKIEKVSQGPISSLDDIKDPFSDIGDKGVAERNAKLESDALKIKHAHELNVPFDSSKLDVRDVRVTRLPCYAGEPLGKERIIIDLYANRKGFSTKDSAGRKILPFDLEYIVSEKRGDSLSRVFSEKCHFNRDVTNEEGRGFTARVITVPFETNKNYRVEVKVNNGIKVDVEKADITMIRGEYPLEIAHKQQAFSLVSGQQTRVPTFGIEPVSKNETLKIFFPVGGLEKDSTGYFSGRAYVSLVDPGKGTGRVHLGEIDIGPLGDTLPPKPLEPPILTYEKLKTGYEQFQIAKLDIKSTSSNGMFIYDIKLPSSVGSGTTKILGLEFYTIDKARGVVKRLGTASKDIQIK